MRNPVATVRRFQEELFRELRRAVDIGNKNREALAKLDERVADLAGSLEHLQKDIGVARGERSGLSRQLKFLQRDVDALQRRALLELGELGYPERLMIGRFGLLSQNEEDGIVLALLRAAGPGPGRCVEIGCGENGGNSGMLVGELGFHGLMVDADEENVATVQRRFPPSRLTAATAFVEPDSVDDLLRSHGFEGEVDVLSIDIDGNDIWVWEALEAVRPRIAVIEFNSLFGPDRCVVVPYQRGFVRLDVAGADGTYFGASLAALAAVGARKGMRLVAVDQRGVNAFFLREDIAPEIPACEPARLWRLLDKYESDVAAGLDLYALAAELELPIEDVEP